MIGAMTSLPELVRRYADAVLLEAPGGARTIRVEQAGEMWLRPGGRARRFRATEEFAIDRVAFSWRARFPMLGPIRLGVTDSYGAGEGGIEIRFLGLPVRRNRGPELAQAQALRYLAELPLVPQAIVANPELDWREVDERTVEVATRAGDGRVAVRLSFDEAGEIVRTAAHRPRAEAGNTVTPWIGTYTNYAVLGGVRVPTRGEVRWDLPEGPFTYWRGTITAVELRP
jgi:hypothetical protein